MNKIYIYVLIVVLLVILGIILFKGKSLNTEIKKKNINIDSTELNDNVIWFFEKILTFKKTSDNLIADLPVSGKWYFGQLLSTYNKKISDFVTPFKDKFPGEYAVVENRL